MKKDTLLLLSIILIIPIICICIFLLKLESKVEENTIPIPQETVNVPISEVTDRNNFYMVQNSVKAFYQYYASMYKEDTNQKEYVEKTYNLLDKEYINFKEITKENVFLKLPQIESVVVDITNMYVSIQNKEISAYFVQGILREEKSKNVSNFEIMMKIDTKNQTCSVLLQDYLEIKYPNRTLGTNLIIEPLNNIEKKGNNYYVYEEISDTTYVKDLFNKYKEEALYNKELAYNSLDIDYRTKRFGTLEKFNEYISTKNTEITNAKLEKYNKTNTDTYTQYVCIDKNGNYYIFRENGVMKYTLILDKYTIDLPEFIEKYNNSNTANKVGYNIQKFLDAINNQDYLYSYNKLDSEFKSVNYPTLESFEKVIKTKLFTFNKVKKVTSFNEGINHAFKLTITNNGEEKEQDMTVIMQLKEGTDFVMSFSFED